MNCKAELQINQFLTKSDTGHIITSNILDMFSTVVPENLTFS